MVCVVAGLEVVKKGAYPSGDMVLCPVPGCPYGKGSGLLRDSVPAHFAATTRAATHAEWSVRKPEKLAAKRQRSTGRLSASALAGRISNFFLKPGEAAAAEEAATVEDPQLQVVPEEAGEDSAPPPAVAAPALPPADGEAPPPMPRSLLAQLANVPRLLVSLIGEVRRLPSAIVAAQREAEEKKADAVAATRIKGATVAELAEKNGLVLEEGVLKCMKCFNHAPRLSGGRSGTQQPGCFDASRRLSELKADISKHHMRPSHFAACNAAAEKARLDKAAASAGWNIGRAIYYRACVPRW